MKLFSPTEVKEANQSQLSRDAARTSLTKETLNKAQVELEKARADFELLLARQRVRWEEESESARATIESLNQEIERLSRERELLRIPIDIEVKKAENMLIEAQTTLAFVKKKEEEVDSLTSLLENKLDDVSDKEIKIEEKEQTLKNREKVFEKQQEMAKAITQDLNLRMAEFLRTAEQRDRELIERKKSLDLIEINLEGDREILRDQQKGLMLEKIRVQDREKMLERDIERLNKNK